jgi:hypothetical protein
MTAALSTAALSTDRFRAARDFVRTVGRPLDAALLDLALGEVGGAAVTAALAPFQNADGGFGHGLEPDIPSPASSALATSIGLRHLVRAAASPDDPLVAGAIRWAAEHIDAEHGVWPIIDAGVDLAPHAPWWAFSDDLAASWNGFRFNPTAEMLAHLYVFAGVVPRSLIAAAEAGLSRTLAEQDALEGAYDLKCAVRLAECGGLPPALQAGLDAVIRRSIAAHDPDDVHSSPFDFAPTPSARFAGDVGDRIEPALAALIAAQQPDGGLRPFWDWAFVDAAAWAKAERDWRGQLTREALETLAAWGRLPRS